ncbi:unnamed protein product [Cylindrotheca closterium]|uniref:Amine oxidase n=1 Tax=Cylindrotheca closterium TaxID=2856 RepID=A0AAD2FTR4_9STRA|nr:unnamed protein product [Cylindrotheca closterium]
MAASPPRIAVVGGGIAGTLASLVLRNRGLVPVIIDQGQDVGGRLRGVSRSKIGGNLDAGAQFLRASDARLQPVWHMLEQQGLLASWRGRFGMLGNSGGGFLPASIVGQATAAGMRKQHPSDSDNKEDQAGDGQAVGASSPTDSGDFCGFVTNYGTNDKVTPTYVAVPNNESLCPNICRLASIDKISSTTVLGAQTNPEGGWVLNVDGDMQSGDMSFDALVLASHDPSLAANTIESIIEAEKMASDASPDDAHSKLLERLGNLVSDLHKTRNAKQPVFSWSGKFPTELTQSLDFDAASVPGSHVVQFVARESSKPQYASNAAEDTEIWTAISTSLLAQDILKRHSGREASEEATTVMSEAVSKLLFQNEANNNVLPQDASAVRWGAAFSSPTLGLKEDSIFLNPWRLAIAGDFVSDAYPSPLEAAALSGLEAGERVAAMFQAMGSIPPPQ